MKRSFILFLTCWFLSSVVYGQVLNESFDATTTPAGWTNTAVFGGPWVFSTSPGWGVAGTPDHTGNGGNYAWMDFSSEDTTVVLTTPAVSVTTLTNPYLEFAYESYVADPNYPLPYNILLIEAWNGSSWTTIANLQQNTAQGWEVLGYNLTGFTYAGGDSAQVRFVAETGGSSADYENDLLLDDIMIKEVPSCFVPAQLAVSNITASSADFGWTQTGTVTSWEVSYGVPGNPPGTGNVATTATNSYTAMGLMSASPYEYYVRAICGPGDTSNWAGPLPFITPCAVFTPAYNTNFSTFLPACWDEADAGSPATGPSAFGTGSWGQAGSSARTNLFTTGKSDWLISPEFDLSTPGPWELVINSNATDYSPTTAFNGMGSDDTVQVVVSTDGGATWRALYTWDVNNPLLFAPNDLIIDISTFTTASNIFAIWVSEGAVNDPEDYYAIINNFEIRVPLTCANPTTLAVSNVTATSAEVTWVAGNPVQLGWEVSVVPAGTPAVGGTAGTSTFNATGLTSNTAYDAYVREICGPGDTTAWLGPVSFATPCAAIIPAYTTNFGTFLPACWDEADAGNPATGPSAFGSSSWGQAGTSARTNIYTTGMSDWLISPEFDLSTPGPWELVINSNATDYSPTTAFSGMGQDDTVQVVVSTDGGASWRALYTWDVNNPLLFAPNDVVIDISTFTTASNIFAIWVSEGTVGGPQDYYAIINNFEIRQVTAPSLDVSVDTLLVDDVYCNVSAVSGGFVVTNNSSVPVSNVPYSVTLNGLPIGGGAIPSLGPNASDTVLVGPIPAPTGAGVIVASVGLPGDTNTSNDARSKTVYISNIDVTTTVDSTILCNGDANGVLSASATNAYGATTYSWSNNVPTATVSNLSAGIYAVIATDSIGCTDSDTVTLVEPAVLVVTGASSNALCNGDANGSIVVTVAGGIAPYTYLWSNGATTATVSNLSAGTYTVTVTDANRCTEVQSFTINEPPAITLNITHNNMDSATAIAGGGAGAFTFAWSDGQTTATASGLMNNTTYMVTVTDANGCTAMDSVNISFINVSTIGKVNSLSMFPNPAHDQVFVDLDLSVATDVQINITNALGQLVSSQALGTIQTQRLELSIKDLPNGMYLVRFQLGEEPVTRKLIISRP
ncbi:MAG: T9SS type A sorting domain-containing protein [Aureispira sp.]